ncbi:MAG: hypothetical protein ACM3NT_04680 [Methylocystaceae bacterium]
MTTKIGQFIAVNQESASFTRKFAALEAAFGLNQDQLKLNMTPDFTSGIIFFSANDIILHFPPLSELFNII